MKPFGIVTLIGMFVLIAIAGCQSNTTTPAIKDNTVQPGVGSEFVFRNMYWDTLGRLTQDFLDTEIVFQSGISYQGKNNVNVISYIWDSTLREPEYLSYEPNGDLSYYIAIPGTRAGWPTYPIASREPSIFIQVDTSYFDTLTGNEVSSFREFVFNYVADSTFMESGQNLDAAQISFRAGNLYSFQNFENYYWIPPSIGYYVRTLSEIGRPYLQNISRTESDLVSYTLK
jgi:hypothetical protein